jgi:hypothetical protein
VRRRAAREKIQSSKKVKQCIADIWALAVQSAVVVDMVREEEREGCGLSVKSVQNDLRRFQFIIGTACHRGGANRMNR